jgi:hypothetical protein
MQMTYKQVSLLKHCLNSQRMKIIQMPVNEGLSKGNNYTMGCCAVVKKNRKLYEVIQITRSPKLSLKERCRSVCFFFV